ncbi:hypothetical protein FA15DRAFT_587525 [Coprinopsis marcescibilis]|uniref:DUF6534 domain-containing protein n=1 Tax=Coprinopsis marcescibilis TaxID=230819 RepID=A0A5C3LEJ1_COPMA|nr:hypothetical protein FA15DRAFT_587525 [Coprinopsis marcescibilis]
MGMFDSTVGAIFIAVVLNTYLSGIVTYQYGLYWTGSTYIQQLIDAVSALTIAGLCISDMFHSICVAYMGWIYAVESFGNPANLINIFWPFPLSAIMMTFTALTTQQFLIYRLHLLTSSLTLKPHLRLIPAIISTILSLTSLTAFAWGMTVGVKVWLAPSMMHLSEVNGLLTVWLTLEVVVDLVLAALLLATLQSKGTGFKQSDRVLRRLIRLSVQTGLCTAIFALLCMILWLTLPNTHWYLLFGLPISRVYTSTLLDTLLSRQRLRGMLNGSDTYVSFSPM